MMEKVQGLTIDLSSIKGEMVDRDMCSIDGELDSICDSVDKLEGMGIDVDVKMRINKKSMKNRYKKEVENRVECILDGEELGMRGREGGSQ